MATLPTKVRELAQIGIDNNVRHAHHSRREALSVLES